MVLMALCALQRIQKPNQMLLLKRSPRLFRIW